MQVDCVEGFDGGLPQGFLLELVEMPALRLVRNLSLLVSTIYLFYISWLRIVWRYYLHFEYLKILLKLCICRVNYSDNSVGNEFARIEIEIGRNRVNIYTRKMC